MNFIRDSRLVILLFVMLLIGSGCSGQDGYKIAPTPMLTSFAEQVDSDNPLPEYPRPQLVRDEWMNLNGLWDYQLESNEFKPVQGLTKKESWTTRAVPTNWEGEILVPFSIDAPLSGVGKILRGNQVLWYQKEFVLPNKWNGQNILLHFEASDWETSVYVNGKRVGQHRGGYDPFTFNVTDQIKKGNNTINVCVWDATEGQSQAIGKQIMPENKKGFRYQPTGGIWKTVWLEPIPENSIEKIKVVPDFDNSTVKINVATIGSSSKLVAQVFDGSKMVAELSVNTGQELIVPINNFKEWNPDTPFLYDLKVRLEVEGKVVDEVSSYFGMRKIEVKTAADGYKRIHLNNKPIFQYGPLDQGYWPNGVLTPPSEEAIKFDLEYLKKIGCNMVRVHIKTHPDRWYYWADKLGLLVWQDMTCMPKYGQKVDDAAAKQWHGEFKSMVDWLHNHPSIVMWVVFNEGWSQHNTEFYTNWIKQYDPSRIINCASGWTDKPAGDVMDVHDYTFYPGLNVADYKLNGERALLIGEAAGINLAIPGHTWYSENNLPEQKAHENYTPINNYSFTEEAGRHTYGSPEVFEEAYSKFIETTRCLNAAGCNGMVYTQISDVEHELNGYLTYDRKVSKIPEVQMEQITKTVYDSPELKPVVSFAAKWKSEDGKNITLPFGEKNKFIKVNSEIASPVSISKSFQLDEIPQNVVVAIKGFTDGEIYLNGSLFRKTKLSARFGEPVINFYVLFDDELNYLKKGENIISIKTDKNPKIELLDAAVFQY